MKQSPKLSNSNIEDLQRAVRAQHSGYPKDALAIYKAILKRDPTNFDANYQKGVLLGQMTRYSEASIAFLHALKVRPQSSDICYNLAYTYQKLGRLDEALDFYDAALRIEPTFAEALVARGNVLSDLRRFDEAIKSYDDALSVKSQSPLALNGRGLAYKELRDFDAALSSYAEAIAIKPDFAEAYSNRAAALEALERFDEALENYARATALKPKFADAHYSKALLLDSLGRQREALAAADTTILLKADDAKAYYFRGAVLNKLMRFEEALVNFDKAIALRPDFGPAYFARGAALANSNKNEAIRCYRKARELGVNEEMVDYMLSGLGLGETTKAAPNFYTKTLFDDYAAKFEDHLVNTLAYIGPKSLVNQFRRYCSQDNLDILDLGCGTGLCGDELQPFARSLIGVDLSPKMLAVAKQKNIYDQLVEAEIVEFLRAEQRQFDLVIAGDVFVYLGKLDECFQQIKRILRPGQWLSFSLESSPDADVELGAELRYSHSDRYIANAAAAHSFRVVSSEYCQVRTQGKVGVEGRVVLLQAI